jgi:putative nucleotidyltransferase with HDIG domain
MPELTGESVAIPIRLCNLPPFHGVAAQVASMADGSVISVQQIAAMIGTDPALAAEVLFLANSSLFGFPGRIPSLRHAIAVLGLDRIKSLACAVALRALARGSGPLIRPCWRHCVACSIIAEELAPAFGCAPEQASAAGLLHDVGRFGFLRSYAKEFGPLLVADYNNPAEILTAERHALNADHQEAGAWLIEYWVLPKSFSEICEHHHAPLQESDSPLLKTIKIACQLADSTGFSVVRYKAMTSYREVLESVPVPVLRRGLPTEEELREKVEAKISVFDS